MSGTLIIVIEILCSLVVGTLSGFAVIYIFNRMPAKWLVDYDETPDPILMDLQVQRIKGWPWRWIYSAGFICLLIRILLSPGELAETTQFAAAGLFACWALLMIGLADLKYMIIPDQFVIMLALTAIGFIPYHETFLDLIYGAALGGGAMLLVALIGGAAYKKEVMGFGDVKLFASLGLVLGLKGTIIVLIGASICAGITAGVGLASGKYKKDEAKPLGPYIAGWGIFYIFVIWPLVMWYQPF